MNCQYLGHHLTPQCKHEALPGRSYCEAHLFDIYQKGTARARRKKDERVAAAVWDLQAEFMRAAEELIAEGYDFAEDRWDVKEVDEEETA